LLHRPADLGKIELAGVIEDLMAQPPSSDQ
jgi:hypothetical protein